LVRTNDGGIEQNALFVELDLKVLENSLPVPSPRPERKSVVDRLPWAEAFGQVSPRNAGLESVENSIDEEAVAQRWSRAATAGKYSR
jgi:hypothetical protein